jgi:hypothetical protein
MHVEIRASPILKEAIYFNSNLVNLNVLLHLPGIFLKENLRRHADVAIHVYTIKKILGFEAYIGHRHFSLQLPTTPPSQNK